MNANGEPSVRLHKVLKKNRLAEVSQFHAPGFYDEIPLYTRESDVSFLATSPLSNGNRILLEFAVKYLESVIWYKQHKTPYFAAISVWECPSDELVVPHLFAWADSRRKLTEALRLHAVRTPFGRKIRRLVSQLASSQELDVREETSTVAEMSRVFIGPSEPLYANLMTVRMLSKRRRSAPTVPS